MSYCRWSEDSDFYASADVSGCWRVEVAGRVFHDHEWAEARGEGGRSHTECHCGEGREFDTPDDAADWIEVLVRHGYRVPSHTIEALREEVAP